MGQINLLTGTSHLHLKVQELIGRPLSDEVLLFWVYRTYSWLAIVINPGPLPPRAHSQLEHIQKALNIFERIHHMLTAITNPRHLAPITWRVMNGAWWQSANWPRLNRVKKWDESFSSRALDCPLNPPPPSSFLNFRKSSPIDWESIAFWICFMLNQSELMFEWDSWCHLLLHHFLCVTPLVCFKKI